MAAKKKKTTRRSPKTPYDAWRAKNPEIGDSHWFECDAPTKKMLRDQLKRCIKLRDESATAFDRYCNKSDAKERAYREMSQMIRSYSGDESTRILDGYEITPNFDLHLLNHPQTAKIQELADTI